MFRLDVVTNLLGDRTDLTYLSQSEYVTKELAW